jgi:magnesium chelatase subunit H
MKPKRTSAASSAVLSTPIRVVIVTLDNHLGGVMARAAASLKKSLPGLHLATHAATSWDADPSSLQACIKDIGRGDIVLATMLFMENHINAVLPALIARRDHCDAMICCMSAAEVMKLTRMGRFTMDGQQSGLVALLRRLRGSSSKSGQSTGAQQLSVLRQLPRILRFIPGTAQDVRAYFLTLQYWLAGSEQNLQRLVNFLVDRYASGPRETLRGVIRVAPPIDYPDVGVYSPRLKGRISARAADLPRRKRGSKGTVGVLIMRSYALAGNTAHYDRVIEQLEARGLDVVTAFASGLDARPAVQRFFMRNGKSTVDAVLSLTGFSLVGGPAYNDANAAQDLLAQLDVPYVAAQALEFQSLDDWQSSAMGLMPIEATMMVAIPELDGATGPMVFGGRSDGGGEGAHDMRAHPERVDALVARVVNLVALRRLPRHDRKLAIVLFNFPPNAGNTGTAANLSVFASLYNSLRGLQQEGYQVELPATPDALRQQIIEGNAGQYGACANVHDRIALDDYVGRETWLEEIEAQWGPAPGKQQTDGRSLFVLGARFGNVLVGVQPSIGYEGDPMRLLFEGGFAPTHAFSAFYRYLREDFAADAVLHFGTHGALEFMPGKQAGLSADCWPDRLIGALPNFYLYASNNPSEGLIAKRRSAATLVSYLTPPVAQADLYSGLIDLKASLDRWRSRRDESVQQRTDLAALIQLQAAELDLVSAAPEWCLESAAGQIEILRLKLLELEQALIPYGLHIVGEPMPIAQRIDMLQSMAQASHNLALSGSVVAALAGGATPREALALVEAEEGLRAGEREVLLGALTELAGSSELLARDHELPALLRALDGSFVRPVPGGDLLRNPEVLPTGRNLHGFDPYRLPSSFALLDGERQAAKLLERHVSDGNDQPETVALVLWGTDNLKSEGAPIAQALALIGARPRSDSYGRIVGAELVPLAQLGRPRIDVVITLSGIFRDLLPLQTRLLADAAYLAAEADEPPEHNFIRKHALAYQQAHGCNLETAALRVFSNCDGAYGSNVNMLVENSRWDDGDELAETYTRRKCYAFSRCGQAAPHAELLKTMLAGVELAYQNLDSVELGVTTIDHYFDTLGGISQAVRRASGVEVPVYISDQTSSAARVRTIAEQVALESRTRVLNPKWYENMLQHGYEGVRHIESAVTNTMGWSATTGQVAPWVYQRLSETFILDETMRKRLAALNPSAALKVAHRLLEAHDRQYWSPDEQSLDALRRAGEDLEDWLEGVSEEVAA